MSSSEERLVRRRHSQSRRPSRVREVWTNYKVELTMLALAGLGLFLVLEQLNIRQSLATWIRAVIASLFGHFQDLDAEISALLTRISLSDVVGVVLLLVALVAVLLRLRWRLLTLPRFADGNCPKCGGAIHRVHRKWYDRVISVYVPVRRYRCHECHWDGLRVGKHHTSARRRSPAPTQGS